MKMPYEIARDHGSRLGSFCGLAVLALVGAVACVATDITDPDPGNGDGTAGTSPGAGNQPGTGGAGSPVAGGANNGGGNRPGSGSGGSTSSPPGTGGSGNTGNTGNPGHVEPPPVGGELSNCTTPGPRLIRRLTSTQFRNTLVAAFQDGGVPTTDIFADPFMHRFRIDADQAVVRDLDAGLIQGYSEMVADWAVKTKLSTLSTCTTLTDANCRKQLIQNVGQKLGREPVSDARATAYDQTLYKPDNVKTFEEFATDVVSLMIQAPSFIYRRELGAQEGGNYKLTPYEIASQLSYFLTDGPPDQQLMEAAKNNKLSTNAELDAQAARLLATDAGRRTVANFVGSWLEIDGLKTKTKDPNIFMLTDELRAAMIQETEKTFLDAFDNGGDLGKLLTTRQTFINQPLAQFYGIQGGGADFTKVDTTGTNRPAGILGQAAFLAHHAQPENSSALQRGRAIRERFLCEPIPEVPKDLNTTLAPASSFNTSRERFEQHSKDPICTACHRQFDPIGFAFENYDGFGRYRTEEVKDGMRYPIDATGTLYGMPEGNIPLDGPQPLIDYLATSDKVRACLVRYWSYFAHGRDNWTEKKCNDDSIRRESAANGNTLKSVLMGILHAPSFTRRVKEH